MQTTLIKDGEAHHQRHDSRRSNNVTSSNRPTTNQISEIQKESFVSEGDFDQYNFDNSQT